MIPYPSKVVGFEVKPPKSWVWPSAEAPISLGFRVISLVKGLEFIVREVGAPPRFESAADAVLAPVPPFETAKVDVEVIALVPFPSKIFPLVSVVAPVPPRATGNVPTFISVAL